MKNSTGNVIHALRELKATDGRTAVGVSEVASWLRRFHRENGGSFVHPRAWYQLARKQLLRSLIKKRVILFYRDLEQRFALANIEHGGGDNDSKKDYVKRKLKELYERRRSTHKKLNKTRRKHAFKRRIKHRTNLNKNQRKIKKSKSSVQNSESKLKNKNSSVPLKSKSTTIMKNEKDKISSEHKKKKSIYQRLENLKNKQMKKEEVVIATNSTIINKINKLKKRPKKININIKTEVPIIESSTENTKLSQPKEEKTTESNLDLNTIPKTDSSLDLSIIGKNQKLWPNNSMDFTKSLANLKPLGWSKPPSHSNLKDSIN